MASIRLLSSFIINNDFISVLLWRERHRIRMSPKNPPTLIQAIHLLALLYALYLLLAYAFEYK